MPYRTPKHVQEKKDAKKQHILNVALGLFAGKGFENTSIQEICKAAGVSVGSMYFYFTGKDDIYEAVYSHINTEYFVKLEEAINCVSSFKELIRKLIETAVLSSVPNIPESQFFITNSSQMNLKIKRDDLLKDYACWFKTLLDQALQQGEVAPQNTELGAVSFIYGLYQSIRYWNIYQLEVSPEKMIDVLYQYHIKGLGLSNTTSSEGRVNDVY